MKQIARLLTVHSLIFFYDSSREIFIIGHYRTHRLLVVPCDSKTHLTKNKQFERTIVTCIMRQSPPQNSTINKNTKKHIDQSACIRKFFAVAMRDRCLTIVGDDLISLILATSDWLTMYNLEGTCHLHCWDHCRQRWK